MEDEEMNKSDTSVIIGMLISIREVARENNEMKTVEHIDKVIEEMRKPN